MCRSIKPLRKPEGRATQEEINEAALQYIRKVSGYRKPSQANQAVFEAAVSEVAEATRKMLENFHIQTAVLMRTSNQAVERQPNTDKKLQHF
jgi:hypothetical protein